MKKFIAVLGLAMLVGGVAFADTSADKVSCSVNGVTKLVKSAAACTTLGGTVAAKKM